MLDDFTIINHKFENLSSIDIACISDVHLGALGQCEKEWADFCDHIKRTPNLFCVLGGDLCNNSIRGVGFANPFDEVYRPREQKRLMVEYLKPIRDRILCSVNGNHEARTIRDADQSIGYDIMDKLDLEDLYRENVAFVKIDLGKRSNEDKPYVSFVLCVTHGSGGGYLLGASANKNARFMASLEGVDCLIVGHHHKPMVSKPARVVVDAQNGCVSMKPLPIVSMCSWLGYTGYAVKKMMTPHVVCDPQILHLGGSFVNKKITISW